MPTTENQLKRLRKSLDDKATKEFVTKAIADKIRSFMPNLADHISNNDLVAIAFCSAQNMQQIFGFSGLSIDRLTFKYIIIRTGAILFNEYTTHSQVAAEFDKVYSAGFVVIGFDDEGLSIKPYGDSDSLKITSDPIRDKIIIADLFSGVSAIKYFGLSVDELYKE